MKPRPGPTKIIAATRDSPMTQLSHCPLTGKDILAYDATRIPSEDISSSIYLSSAFSNRSSFLPTQELKFSPPRGNNMNRRQIQSAHPRLYQQPATAKSPRSFPHRSSGYLQHLKGQARVNFAREMIIGDYWLDGRMPKGRSARIKSAPLGVFGTRRLGEIVVETQEYTRDFRNLSYKIRTRNPEAQKFISRRENTPNVYERSRTLKTPFEELDGLSDETSKEVISRIAGENFQPEQSTPISATAPGSADSKRSLLQPSSAFGLRPVRHEKVEKWNEIPTEGDIEETDKEVKFTDDDGVHGVTEPVYRSQTDTVLNYYSARDEIPEPKGRQLSAYQMSLMRPGTHLTSPREDGGVGWVGLKVGRLHLGKTKRFIDKPSQQQSEVNTPEFVQFHRKAYLTPRYGTRPKTAGPLRRQNPWTTPHATSPTQNPHRTPSPPIVVPLLQQQAAEQMSRLPEPTTVPCASPREPPASPRDEEVAEKGSARSSVSSAVGAHVGENES